MELHPERVKTDQLLIDPNNPRYFDLLDHEIIAPDRYDEEQVQAEATEKLFTAEDTRGVKQSILANGFINFEYIVVKPYQDSDKFLVIEGNRRLAAINRIREDHLRGRLPSGEKYERVVSSLGELDVLVFSGTVAEEKIIQGIRHVSGPREWRPYQQALLVQDLREQQGMEFADIQDSLGLRASVVRRSYNTLKAFEQMREDEDYRSLADKELFSLFQEMVGRPSLRTWLNWSDEQQKFLNNTNRKHIYRMIAGDYTSDETPERIIRNPQDMRIFARIVAHEHKETVLERLINGDISIEQARALLEPGNRAWDELVATVTQALEKLPADELQSLSDDNEQLLKSLADVIARKVDQATKLKGSQTIAV